MNSTTVKPGVEITIRALRWSAGWEFDCPTVIISPAFRYYEDGRSLEYAIEDFLIDACIDGRLTSDPAEVCEWRGWSQAYLKRKFYRKHTQRATVKVRFILDEDGELSWEDVREEKS